jgi:hypothetical protein
LDSLSLLNEEDKDWMNQEVRHILQLLEEEDELDEELKLDELDEDDQLKKL